jgi:hypothetical protein
MASRRMAADTEFAAILRDASLRSAPQDEVGVWLRLPLIPGARKKGRWLRATGLDRPRQSRSGPGEEAASRSIEARGNGGTDRPQGLDAGVVPDCARDQEP